MDIIKAKKNNIAHEIFIGPIPPPSDLEKYENIAPGSAQQILTMAQNQSQHRQQMEQLLQKQKYKLERKKLNTIRFGQVFAFIIMILALCGGIFLIFNDKTIIGTLIAGSAIASIISAFLKNPL